jgi:hypothetical protein
MGSKQIPWEGAHGVQVRSGGLEEHIVFSFAGKQADRNGIPQHKAMPGLKRAVREYQHAFTGTESEMSPERKNNSPGGVTIDELRPAGIPWRERVHEHVHGHSTSIGR